MDLETVSADHYGHSLQGLGVNLLVPNIWREIDFLTSVFTMRAARVSQDFAIIVWQNTQFMLHADATYHSHPLTNLLPENPPRGAGAEWHLYHENPDIAQQKAQDLQAQLGCMVLQPAKDKPHGLREAFILSPSGYCWVPSIPLAAKETIYSHGE